ncbi:MAG: hypothetical protein V1494_01315 [Candidatus Diapherotrites archaeon]
MPSKKPRLRMKARTRVPRIQNALKRRIGELGSDIALVEKCIKQFGSGNTGGFHLNSILKFFSPQEQLYRVFFTGNEAMYRKYRKEAFQLFSDYYKLQQRAFSELDPKFHKMLIKKFPRLRTEADVSGLRQAIKGYVEGIIKRGREQQKAFYSRSLQEMMENKVEYLAFLSRKKAFEEKLLEYIRGFVSHSSGG